MRTLVWFRSKDLRITDHPPLSDAARGDEVVPLFLLDPCFLAPERAREMAHRVQFLLESLADLRRSLEALGSRLVLVRGTPEVLPQLCARLGIRRVVAQSWVAPAGRKRDQRVRDAVKVPFDLFDSETLVPPGSVLTSAGKPFSVFTPFARSFAAAARIEPPLPPPVRLAPLPSDVEDVLARHSAVTRDVPTLAELGVRHEPRLQRGGEREAQKRLQAFVSGAGRVYHEGRDRLDIAGTSRLSADLRFGTLSPRAVWHAVRKLPAKARAAFENELVWREFSHALLWHHPELLSEPFRPKFEAFPWRTDEPGWRAWVDGTTGYPVVDASARQLLAEGFVPNRARMIAASFLTKHLLIDYRRGEDHYMRHLTDGDWAQNNAGWQWSAGTGSDAQPYFRIFNPVLQGQKFDPEGAYVRRWLPELEKMPARHIHAPWRAPAEVLAAAGVRLGETYPRPVVDHDEARARYLETAASSLSL